MFDNQIAYHLRRAKQEAVRAIAAEPGPASAIHAALAQEYSRRAVQGLVSQHSQSKQRCTLSTKMCRRRPSQW